MSMTAESASAAAPAVLGAAVLAAGPPAAEAVIIWSACMGGLLCGYGGSMLQLLRESEGRQITRHDWLRFALRVSASLSFGVLVALAVAALAGVVEGVPAVAGHPFIVAFIAGVVSFLAPIGVPEIQRIVQTWLRQREKEQRGK